MRSFTLSLLIIILSFFYHSCSNPLKLADRAGWCEEIQDLIVEPNEIDEVDDIVLIEEDDDDDYFDNDHDHDHKGIEERKVKRGPDVVKDIKNKERYAICHLPPGNPLNARTLWLPKPALKAHLAHGDYLGECE